MPIEILEAKSLIEQALVLLDSVGELSATPHLDMALHMLETFGDSAETSKTKA